MSVTQTPPPSSRPVVLGLGPKPRCHLWKTTLLSTNMWSPPRILRPSATAPGRGWATHSGQRSISSRRAVVVVRRTLKKGRAVLSSPMPRRPTAVGGGHAGRPGCRGRSARRGAAAGTPRALSAGREPPPSRATEPPEPVPHAAELDPSRVRAYPVSPTSRTWPASKFFKSAFKMHPEFSPCSHGCILSPTDDCTSFPGSPAGRPVRPAARGPQKAQATASCCSAQRPPTARPLSE